MVPGGHSAISGSADYICGAIKHLWPPKPVLAAECGSEGGEDEAGAGSEAEPTEEFGKSFH